MSFFVSTISDRIQLHAPPTSRDIDYEASEFYREGFIISLSLEDGSIGFGEVGVFEFHCRPST